mmetsp:Transcript_32314/g.102755  ORF Transcript_32314/g.102755 Transcript_32314/m.102755 type:complete len:98 (+) Transcript_32314:435-728(+)
MEQKKRQFNQIVANITDVCWDTCMGTPGSKLSSSETSCLTYCAQRWFDATQVREIPRPIPPYSPCWPPACMLGANPNRKPNRHFPASQVIIHRATGK